MRNSIGTDLRNHQPPPHTHKIVNISITESFLLPLCILSSYLPSPNNHYLPLVTVDELAFSTFLYKWKDICIPSYLASSLSIVMLTFIHLTFLHSSLECGLPWGGTGLAQGTELDTGHKGRSTVEDTGVLGRPLDLASE